jgi:alginate O-acetyltransferase complex protein AlgI
MLFNSYLFWFFFACVIILYRLLPHRGQNVLLLVASYVFYGFWDWRFTFVMLFSTAVDYFAAIGVDQSSSHRRRKTILIISICVQVGLLCVFKYFGFFAREFGGLLGRIGLHPSFPTLEILLPVGISFYTLQTMSYTIDVYRGQFKCTRNFIDFALFVSFFPHLVAGPLVRASNLLPQISHPRPRRADDFRDGLYYILVGLFKKVVVADNLSVIVTTIFRTDASRLSGAECLVGVYAFAFQIYGDFSGYSSIAQGVARWLNIDLMPNFNLPYFATTPSDFWSRWHISLSTWLRDYVYVPLARRGGRATRGRLYSSVLIVMLLSGLWHGAGWNFLAWGLFHGLVLCGYRLFSSRRHWFFKLSRERVDVPYQSALSRLFKILLMFHLVCLGWLLFRADSLGHAWSMLGRILGDFRITPFAVSALVTIAFYTAPLLAYEFWLERKERPLELTRLHWLARGAVYTYFVMMLWFFPPQVSNVFIYFQF